MFTTKYHLLVLSLFCCNCYAWRKVRITYSNLVYNYEKDYTEMNATLSADGSLSMFVKPSMDIDRLFLTVQVKFSSNGSENFDIDFMNKTVDICKFSREPRYEPLIQLVYKIMSQKIRLPQRCPVKKNQIFYTKNFNFETDRLPPIFRETKLWSYFAVSTVKNGVLQEMCNLLVAGQMKHLN